MCTSVKEIESPLSDEIQNDLQEEDRKSPAFSSFSIDKDKLNPGNTIWYSLFFRERLTFN